MLVLQSMCSVYHFQTNHYAQKVQTIHLESYFFCISPILTTAFSIADGTGAPLSSNSPPDSLFLIRTSDSVTEYIGFADRDGNVVISPQFEAAGTFSEGLAAVKIGDKYGYIDKTGTMVIELQFDCADDFRGGRANVKIGKAPDIKYGYIDNTGHWYDFSEKAHP